VGRFANYGDGRLDLKTDGKWEAGPKHWVKVKEQCRLGIRQFHCHRLDHYDG